MTTREQFAALPRAVRAVPLPGGGTVHVRDLTIAELRAVDRAADALPEKERGLAWTIRLVAAALCCEDGSPVFDLTELDAEAAEVERWFSSAQLRAIAEAAVPTRESEKKD